MDAQYSQRMVFSFLKKKLAYPQVWEDSSLNKEVPDVKRAPASIPDPGSQMLVIQTTDKYSDLWICI